MARLKFVVFAVLAIGLWAFHLTRVSSLALGASVEQAQSALAGATAPMAVALEGRRSLVQSAALKLAASPAALNAGPKAGGKAEAPSVDRFAAVRGAVSDAVDAALKESLFVAVQNDVGVLLARGTGEPVATAPEGLDLAGVAQAGAAGALRTVEGAPYFVVAVPMFISDKNEVKASGFAAIGLPLLPDEKALEPVKKALGLEGLALVSAGKVAVLSGDKGALEALAGKLKAGQAQPTGAGALRGLGPLDLPMMVDNPVHGLAGLQAIPGTTYEVLATASSKASLEALADYQVFALGGLVALVLLALVVLVLIGGGEEQGAAMVMPPPMQVPQVVTPAARRDEPIAPAPLSMPEPEPAPEASPDDFDFPASSPSSLASSPSSFPVSSPSSFAPPPPVATGQAPAYEPEPMSDPFAQAAPPAPPPPPVATSEQAAYVPTGGLNDDMEEGQRTVNYPVFKPGTGAPPPPAADPFAMAAAQMGDEGLMGGEDNPESTRVAAVPQELIRAARAGSTGNTSEKPALKTGASIPKIGSVPPAGGGAGEEERHFQEVFRDFVATREKCGEPADGLTFDKFKTKLLKNKEQLVTKYACRTVRFQVYVKDGKAALKATPVKD